MRLAPARSADQPQAETRWGAAEGKGAEGIASLADRGWIALFDVEVLEGLVPEARGKLGRVVGGHPPGQALARAGDGELVAVAHAHEKAAPLALGAVSFAVAEPGPGEGALDAESIALAVADGACVGCWRRRDRGRLRAARHPGEDLVEGVSEGARGLVFRQRAHGIHLGGEFR